MIIKKKSYIFSKNFSLFYFKSSFFVLSDNGYLILKLPQIYYEKRYAEKLSLIFFKLLSFSKLVKIYYNSLW